MSLFYMTFWTILIVLVLAPWRLRNWGQLLVVLTTAVFILGLSQLLFIQLATLAGLAPELVLTEPARFLQSGPVGWMALLVRPCGWLGPIVGMNLLQRWQNDWQNDWQNEHRR